MAAPSMLKSVDACECGRWHLQVWSKLDPTQHSRIAYKCRSWRHPGPCRLWRGAQDFIRVRDAVKKRGDWVYCVLTYAQRDWASPGALFKAGIRHWSALRKRLCRRYGKLAYIQTWEAHKSGWPHVNVLIGNPDFHAESLSDWRRVRKRVLIPAAVACGFGPIAWLECMRDSTSIAGYLTKLARELTGSTVKNQVPIEAPPHFRRLRASQGLLPRPLKDDAITGRMWFASVDSFLQHLSPPASASESTSADDAERLHNSSTDPDDSPTPSDA